MLRGRRPSSQWRSTGIAIVGSAIVLGGCEPMTPAQQGTAIGAVAGGIAGHLIARGHPLGTIGGAAVGGIVGHQLAGNLVPAAPSTISARADE